MPMLIGRFHKLIQSRVTWIIFLVVIVFSFVVWGTPFLFSGRNDGERGAAGILNGKAVSRRDFWNAVQHVRLAVALGAAGQLPPVDDKTEPIFRRLAWRRIASLQEAARMGLLASDKEVQEAIRSQPIFQHEGRFSLDAYRNFVGRFLGEQGLGEGFFQEHVAQELALQRLRMAAVQAVLAPPADIERIFSVLEDRFRIEYVSIPPADDEAAPEVSKEALQEFFERNASRYEVPPRVIVRYVRFDTERYLPSVEPPAADDIEEYYDDHRADFTVTEDVAPTNATAGATNAAPAESVTRVRPLDEVRDSIVSELRRRRAADRADQDAMEMISRISPDRPTPPLSFEAAAREFNVTVHTSPPLMRAVALMTVDAGLNFNRAAFDLRDTPEEYFSSMPVRGPGGCYVLALQERIPARIPDLAEVRDEVIADARREAAEKARDAALEALLADLRSGAATMADVAARMNVPLQTPPEFTATTMPTNHPALEVLLSDIATCNPGEFTPVVRGPENARLIARVVDRTPAPRSRLAQMSQSIADLILRERENGFHRSFEEELIRRGQLQDRLDRPTRSEDDQDT